MNDNEIIDLYFARSEDAIRESEQKYGTYCLSVAENILSDREDAKECVNDTWLAAWNSIPPQNPRHLKLFFAKITRNAAYNKYRAKEAKKRGKGEISAVLDELEGILASSDMDTHIENRAISDSINSFLATLEVRERGIFIRRYFFVEPTADIAARYGVSRANVHAVLSRTRKKLKKYLNKEGITV